jgi:hypothetical protein
MSGSASSKVSTCIEELCVQILQLPSLRNLLFFTLSNLARGLSPRIMQLETHQFPCLDSSKPFQILTEKNKTSRDRILDEEESDLPNLTLETILVCNANEVNWNYFVSTWRHALGDFTCMFTFYYQSSWLTFRTRACHFFQALSRFMHS